MADYNPLQHCRVCGLNRDDFPWGEDGESPTFNFCACCGVEFGYGDSILIAAQRWREKWLEAGAQWRWPEYKPPDWDLETQLKLIPPEFR